MLKYQSDILDNIERKEKEIEEKMDEQIYPTKEIVEPAFKLLEEYIKKNNRIVYGGTSIDLLIKRKNPTFEISTSKYPDYDFYSDEPLKDLHEICDMIHNKIDSLNITGSQAMHEGTYKIFIGHRIEFADISYIPKRLYNSIDTITLDGIKYVPHKISLIDQYRRICNSLDGSWFKINKTLNRVFMMENIIQSQNIIVKPEFNKKPDEIKSIIKKIRKMIGKLEYEEKDKIVITGNLCFNIILKLLGNKYSKYETEVNCIELYSSDYLTLAQKIVGMISNSNTVELQPFFQYYENGIFVVYKKHVIVKIYKTTRCLPYIETDEGHICSIDLLREFLLSRRIWEKIKKYKVESNISEYLYKITLLIEQDYYENNKLDKNDDLFERANINCIGTTLHMKVREQMEIQNKIKQKKLIKYRYTPSHNKTDVKIPEFKFPNISGEYVYNEKYLKLKNISIIPSYNLIL